MSHPLSRISRLANSLVPAPSPDALVTVAELSRGELRMARHSLADVGLDPVVSEFSRPAGGDSRFRVLVARRDAGLAREVLAA
jgi:hypothetical protein